MNRPIERGRFITAEWIAYHGHVTFAEINAAVARGELSPPTPNAILGKLTWDRDEAWEWIEYREVRTLLKSVG